MIIGGASLVSAAVPNALRSAFPVLERVAYLNAGSVGPVPRAAAEAAAAELRAQARPRAAAARRSSSAWSSWATQLRGRIAALMGCSTRRSWR